jgi:hypothetical protein
MSLLARNVSADTTSGARERGAFALEPGTDDVFFEPAYEARSSLRDHLRRRLQREHKSGHRFRRLSPVENQAPINARTARPKNNSACFGWLCVKYTKATTTSTKAAARATIVRGLIRKRTLVSGIGGNARPCDPLDSEFGR